MENTSSNGKCYRRAISSIHYWRVDLFIEKKNTSRFLLQHLIITLQGINISHLGKRKIIFKMPFLGDMLVPWRVRVSVSSPVFLLVLFGCLKEPLDHLQSADGHWIGTGLKGFFHHGTIKSSKISCLLSEIMWNLVNISHNHIPPLEQKKLF